MEDKAQPTTKPAKSAIIAELDMLAHDFGHEVLYTFNKIPIETGACDGNPPVPCPYGGRCIAGQCYWGAADLLKLGIKIRK